MRTKHQLVFEIGVDNIEKPHEPPQKKIIRKKTFVKREELKPMLCLNRLCHCGKATSLCVFVSSSFFTLLLAYAMIYNTVEM